jgi:RNA methyltransferase, TrmH family
VITSVRNTRVANAVKLKKRAYREEERRFLVEGAQAVAEALERPGALEVLFHTDPEHPLVVRAREALVKCIQVSQEVAERLTSAVTPQGLVGIGRYLDVELDAVSDEAECIVLLHAVRDPGNAGTVLRSADAAGARAVAFCDDSVDLYNPKTVRASAGSLFHLPVLRELRTMDAIERLRGSGRTILAMDAGGDEDLYEAEFPDRVAFLFGNEAWGLPPEIAGLADRTVRVPIPGRAESLNLAAAAAICLFEWARRRRQGPLTGSASGRTPLETLITSAAHDIRSPLTAMKGFGYALATRWQQMSEDQRALMLEGIVYDTDRLDTILRLLVDAARIADGTLELFPERVDVGDVVRKLEASLSRDPEHPGIVWDSDAVPAFVDPERLRSILESFVEALVWWGHEGPIRVAAACEGGRLVVEAFRAGTGIGAEGAATLFLPRRPGEGSGSKIGLFVSDGLARAMGGSASVEVDRGLRFRLDVPAGVDESLV